MDLEYIFQTWPAGLILVDDLFEIDALSELCLKTCFYFNLVQHTFLGVGHGFFALLP